MSTTNEARQIARDSAVNAATERATHAIRDEMRQALIAAIGNTLDLCAHTTALTYEPSDQGDYLELEEVECAEHDHRCPATLAWEKGALVHYGDRIDGSHIIWAEEALGLVDVAGVNKWRIETKRLTALLDA